MRMSTRWESRLESVGNPAEVQIESRSNPDGIRGESRLESRWNPDGIRGESRWNPDGIREESRLESRWNPEWPTLWRAALIRWSKMFTGWNPWGIPTGVQMESRWNPWGILESRWNPDGIREESRLESRWNPEWPTLWRAALIRWSKMFTGWELSHVTTHARPARRCASRSQAQPVRGLSAGNHEGQAPRWEAADRCGGSPSRPRPRPRPRPRGLPR